MKQSQKMKFEIEKLKNEYQLKIEIKNRLEIVYIKDLKKLYQYVLVNLLYGLEGKSQYFDNEKYAKVNIEYGIKN
jgi:hypothetical protein